MKYVFSAVFTNEDRGYSVLCPELGVASQGETLEEAEKNIKEAVELYIDDLPPSELERFAKNAAKISTIKTFEIVHA